MSRCSSLSSKFTAGDRTGAKLSHSSRTGATNPRTVRATVGSERGQASVEWVALLLCVALALGAVVAFVPLVDGRSLGGTVVHAIVCAVRGDCAAADGDRALAAAYGMRDAALVRR